VLYRITLEGDVPVGVDGRHSNAVLGKPFSAFGVDTGAVA
jgi:taurine dioxygenase